MLIVETVVRIRREHAAGKAIKAIARDLRLSRKVVRKAIRSPEAAFNYQRKVQRCRGSVLIRIVSMRCLRRTKVAAAAIGYG